MRRTVFGSATKFCPSARLGASPCSASSSRIRVGVCVTAPASQTPNSYNPPQQNRQQTNTQTPPHPPPQQPHTPPNHKHTKKQQQPKQQNNNKNQKPNNKNYTT